MLLQKQGSNYSICYKTNKVGLTYLTYAVAFIMYLLIIIV